MESPSMKKFTLFLQKHSQILYNLFLFLVAAMCVLYVLPDQGRFKYEYELGQPWLHDDLESPFNFPLYKVKSELRAEREAWEESYPLYFEQNNDVETVSQEKWTERVQRLPFDSTFQSADADQLGRLYLDALYSEGIITPPSTSGAMERIWYLANRGVFVQVDPDQFIEPERATTLLRSYIDTITNPGLKNILASNLPNMIRPNITFDSDLTTKKKNQYLNSISPTEGLVSEGEIIVYSGQVVDANIEQRIASFRRTLEGTSNTSSHWLVLVGHFLLTAIVLVMLFLFLRQFRPQILVNSNSLTLILVSLVGMVLLADLVISYDQSLIYIIPFPLVPIIMRSFYDTRLALFIHLMVIMIVGLVAPNSFEFIFLQFMAGIFSIVTVSSLYRRSQLFMASAKITVIYILSYFAFTLIRGDVTNSEHLYEYGYFALNGLMSVMMAFPLIFIFEKMFSLVSDLTLLELGDTNSPLLRELRLKAPGTFQHSLQVANLAESVIDDIGGNSMLVRTGALYHDIGKMLNPIYFVENQNTGINPHDDLDSLESAEIIVDHVLEGIILAKSKRIPDMVIDFIRTHHGTTKVEYFFRKYSAEHEGELPEEIAAKFKYPGPKPFSKETAVLMMSDTVEAATRSLVQPTADQLAGMVDKLIDHQQNSGQFDNANITLGEISRARQILKKKLMSIHHLRVEYPD